MDGNGFIRRLAVCILFLAARELCAGPADVDPAFDPGSTVNGSVNAVVVQPDGKVLAAGAFSAVHGALRPGVARFNPDGSTDATFHPDFALAGNTYSTPVINCLAPQGDGKWLIGGSFLAASGSACENLARLNADGTWDNSFVAQAPGPGSYDLWGGSVNLILPAGGGKNLIAGGFTSVNGVPRTSLARLNPDGSLDTTFNAVLATGFAQPAINAVALQSDGKILIAGNFNQVDGVTENYCARLNADGTLDASFVSVLGANDGGTIQTIICLTNGQALIGGVFSTIDGVAHNGIARLNADGSCDPSFQAGAGWVYDMAIQSDGKILLGGSLANGQGIITRLNADASPDASFTGSATTSGGTAYALALQSDGKILLGGSFQLARNNVARLNADGSVDNSFDNGPEGPNGAIVQLAIQPDQKTLLCGNFTSVDGAPQNQLARLNADGSRDTNFLQGLTGYNSISCLALQSDGKILLGGTRASVIQVARFNSDGSPDNSFTQAMSAANGQFYCLAVQADGRILVGGSFTTFNGGGANCLARCNPDGSIDTSFLPGLTGASGPVYQVVVQLDGKILIGGLFNSVNGVTRNYIARLNADGSLDETFLNGGAGANNLVGGLALQADGKILVGGRFTTFNGLAITNIVRLLGDGSVDATFQCSGLPTQWLGGMFSATFGIQRDGRILVMEEHYPFAAPANNFFCLLPNGSVDSSFLASQIGPNLGVRSLGIQADGKVVIGGNFSIVNQTPRSFVARLMGEYAGPSITYVPPGATAEAGGNISLLAAATGYPPLAYQWRFNGVSLAGAGTNRCLYLTNLPPAASGAYTLAVTNADGAVTSAPVTLSVIPPVNRRLVPALALWGNLGGALNVECTGEPGPTATWQRLDTISLATSPQFYFDASLPPPPQRFYRVSQPAPGASNPALSLPAMIPAIALTGNVGDRQELDYINVLGPTNAWVNLATVTLTNTSQLYFDASCIGQPARLYRLVPAP